MFHLDESHLEVGGNDVNIHHRGNNTQSMEVGGDIYGILKVV
jgi:hypothetical protein